jgi:hypothetical protein
VPNPFPGMDPYLEGNLWMTVHTDLCAEIARQLSPKLEPKYVALSTRRIVLAPPDETELPFGHRFTDVGIMSIGPSDGEQAGAVATAPLVLPFEFPEPIPHVGVEIRDMDGQQLVACIEVLSPTNKRGSGVEEYSAKRLQILSGPAHLIEIDLLRVGARFPTTKPLPTAPYFVFISRAEQRKKVEIWPIQLEQPLPTVPVPLLPEDSEVYLDLQAALSTVYNIIKYDRLLDYSQPPPGPMTPEQMAWIDERLKQSGRRKGEDKRTP